jgi:putative flippase GtrA
MVLFLKFLKYCIVGFSGMLVDFGITWLLKEKVRANKYLANTCGFISAATSNYVLNRVWTFESQNDQIVSEYAGFFIIAIIGLGLNNLILMVLADKLKLNFYLSKLIAIVLVTLWNFIMNFLFTFADKL